MADHKKSEKNSVSNASVKKGENPRDIDDPRNPKDKKPNEPTNQRNQVVKQPR